MAISRQKWNFEQAGVTRENSGEMVVLAAAGVYRKKRIAGSIHLKLLQTYSPFGCCHSIDIERLLLGYVSVYTTENWTILTLTALLV